MSLPQPGSENVYVDPKAAVQVVLGTSGAMQLETWKEPAPAWSAFRNANRFDSYGYGTVMAHNSTHLQYQFHPLSHNASAADHFWIVKSSPSS